ncbi:MAG: nitroreductase family deazaflavin-dependent oxidoreductase [Ktedonobacteraceae bacterium]|nr:nitroreductase family deazaflavin-dependent oxidoreductase [Ktedonobacteraceae bacterium]
MSSMTILMIGLMFFIMAGLMTLLMVIVHAIKSNGNKQHAKIQIVFPAINWMIKVLLRLGIPMTILGPMKLLTVRGRKTGILRTVPVDFYEYAGQRFLIATHGLGNWVYNLRTEGEGSLSLGRSHQTFTAFELPPEEAGPVIKEVLGPLFASPGMRGSILRRHFGVTADSSLNDFTNAARSHPVFRISSSEVLSSQPQVTQIN